MYEGSAASSISIPSIYLRSKSHPSNPSKRTIFPSSMQQLLKQANVLFRNLRCVRSIYSQDGCLVEDILEIKPGDVLYVSSQEPDFRAIRKSSSPSKGQSPSQSKGKNSSPGKENRQGALSEDSDIFKRRFGGDAQQIQTKTTDDKTAYPSKIPSPRNRTSNAKENPERQSSAQRTRSPNGQKVSSDAQSPNLSGNRGSPIKNSKNQDSGIEDQTNDSSPSRTSGNRGSSTISGANIKRSGGASAAVQKEASPNPTLMVLDDTNQSPSKATTKSDTKSQNQQRTSPSASPSKTSTSKTFGGRSPSPATNRNVNDQAYNKLNSSPDTGNSSQGGKNGGNEYFPGNNEEGTRERRKYKFSPSSRFAKKIQEIDGDDEEQQSSLSPNSSPTNSYDETNGSSPGRDEQNLLTPRRGSADFEYNDLQSIFETYFPEIALESFIPESSQQLPFWAKEVLSKAPRIEDQQQSYWFNNVLNFVEERGFRIDGPLYAHEELWQKAINIVTSHNRNGFGKRLAITGPRQSGKSTFLSLIAKAALAELLRTGLHRKVFVLAFDCLEVSSDLTDPDLLFNFITTITIQALVLQMPVLEKYSGSLTRLFKAGMPPARLIADYPSFGQEAVKIAKLLIEFKNDPDCMCQFYTQLFLLPEMLSRAAGFTEVLFILDDFDAADAIAGTEGFKDSRQIYIIEYLKLALKRASFIISHQDLERFYGTLQPTEEDGIELLSATTMVTTFGLLEYETEPELVVRFEGNQLPFAISKDDCGGAPGFLKRWTELNKELDSVDPDDIQSEETVLFVTHVQQFVEDLYEIVQEDDDGILVVSVRRADQ